MSASVDNCPACGVSWVGDAIPEHLHEHYSPPYVWRREICIYSMALDRWTHAQCPDCLRTFPREAVTQ